MRNTLPNPDSCKQLECGVINLDDESGVGTHWVSYYRNKMNCYYFDSFGNLQPPREFVRYVGNKCMIYYNHARYQTYGKVNCGHLCIKFLYNMYMQGGKIE